MKHLKWTLPPEDNERELRVVELAATLGISYLVAKMLVNRGLVEPGECRTFLDPQMKYLLHPYTLPGCREAAERIGWAIRNKEKIVIFGDYDVDGVTATTTLYHALKHFGADVETYLPHRLTEGYGLNPPTAEKIILGLRPSLIVTVDCGITAVDSALLCRKYDVDLIVTDHHEWQNSLPDCRVTVHPRLGGGTYLNPNLCGAGVAFKVAWAVGLFMSTTGEKVDPDFSELLRDLLCFTCLGTIADCMPLTGENRILAVSGLRRLPRQDRFVGLTALLKSASIKDTVDGYQVGFMLAPRLNAAGRMGHAEEALRLFTRADEKEADEIATELERKNRDRQQEQKDIVEEAMSAARYYLKELPHCVVVCGKNWHPGIIGIVASRLVEEFDRPALVLHYGENGNVGGSGRSVPGFSIAEALKANEHLLTRWGGHAAACGVKLKSENLVAFHHAFDEYCRLHLDLDEARPRLHIDAVAALPEITVDLAKEMKWLGPFGYGNRRPLLVVRDAVAVDAKAMGKEGKHLTFVLTQGRNRMKCVAWNEGELAHKLPTGTRVDVVVEPQVNEWQGRESVELLVRDILPASEGLPYVKE